MYQPQIKYFIILKALNSPLSRNLYHPHFMGEEVISPRTFLSDLEF